MGFFDALNHLANLFLPALGLSAVATSLAKLLWRHELAAVRWLGLFGPAALACVAATLAGLLLQSRDGRMATYAAMVLACALALWWRGFGPGRGR